jgi:hypothetical protein
VEECKRVVEIAAVRMTSAGIFGLADGVGFGMKSWERPI